MTEDGPFTALADGCHSRTVSTGRTAAEALGAAVYDHREELEILGVELEIESKQKTSLVH